MIAKQPGPAAGKPAAGTFDLDAAQRRNLARSLLECRLHGSRTLGNMIEPSA
jgi:hypothetical protein